MREGVLITGGSGFLGHALVERLLADGCPRICIYSRGEFRQFLMRQEFKGEDRLRWFIGDVRDRDRLERAMQGVDSVIHAAALKRIEVGAENPDEMKKTNIDGSLNVVEAARRSGVGKALLVSSDKAFEPVSPYGQSKAMAESLFLQGNVPGREPRFAVVRYGNVAGSTGSVIPTWRSAKDGKVTLTDPDVTRFWMAREEAAKLVIDTLASMQGGEVAIPDLPAFRLGDLALAMGVSATVTSLSSFERRHESMSATQCSATARRMSVEELCERLAEVMP